jgi:hypothetical protein
VCDNKDFEPVVRKAHRIKPITLGIGDKGFDDEDNHRLLREELGAMSIIPSARPSGWENSSTSPARSRRKNHSAFVARVAIIQAGTVTWSRLVGAVTIQAACRGDSNNPGSPKTRNLTIILRMPF